MHRKVAVLAIDQGTTSTRALVFNDDLKVAGLAQRELSQHYPAPGHVEHDPEEVWSATLAVVREAITRAGCAASDLAAIGITNQRETTVVWDRRTGRPVHRAIVWQDRRTADHCRRLRDLGLEAELNRRTGLRLDPYFSAAKIAWILDNVDGARDAANAGHLAFGTIECFLLNRLTGGRVHVSDATNASRTALFDIRERRWDEGLLEAFGVPAAMQPDVRTCNAEFGVTDRELFGAAIPVRAMAGDQHAATIGQACFSPGMMKATYGTGCFGLLNTGEEPVTSRNRLLTTIAYDIDDEPTYALEGAIFIAGAAVQWLRDGLGIIAAAPEMDRLASAADAQQEIVVVPAFVGLGAPYWEPEARGAVFGLTRNTGRAEFARAVLEANAYQTRDLLAAMQADWAGASQTVLRVDGGMVASDLLMQLLADTLSAPVERPALHETTALGVGWLAGSSAGVMPDRATFAAQWAAERRCSPSAGVARADAGYARWQRAVRAVIGYAREARGS